MSRSSRHGCKKSRCGICSPHKKWGKGKKAEVQLPAGDRRRAPREQDLSEFLGPGQHATNE